MLDYELFKEAVEEKIKDYLSPEYQDYNVKVYEVPKVNTIKDTLTIYSNENSSCVPNIYINDMYEEYKITGDIESTLKSTVELIEKAMDNVPDILNLSWDLETAKKNIVLNLINTEQNRELLDNVPHRPFNDLSVIYRWIIDNDIEGIHSTLVTNNLQQKLRLTEEEIFELAKKNTMELFPVTIKSMNEVIYDIFIKDGMPKEMVESFTEDIPKENEMYVISNENSMYGASAILYEDKIHELAEKLDSDLYMMPSSIHEFLAISSKFGDPSELAEIVMDVNFNQVSLAERLSNEVYKYDKEARTIELATNVPNKSISKMSVKWGTDVKINDEKKYEGR